MSGPRLHENNYQRYLTAYGHAYRALQRQQLLAARRHCHAAGVARRGLALWEPLDWDSARLGCRVARISHLLAVAGPGRRAAGEAVLRAAVRRARGTADLLTLRLDGDDLPLLQAAETCGFVTVDLLHTFYAARGSVRGSVRGGVRPGTAADLPAVRRIARGAFAHSRLYQDPRIPARRAACFYADLTEAIAAQACVFLVAEERGTVTGFALGTRGPGTRRPRLGHLWLIAVARAARGRGTGRRLLAAFLPAMFRQVDGVEISTQCANAAATRLYAGCGLLPQARIVTLHRWIDPC